MRIAVILTLLALAAASAAQAAACAVCCMPSRHYFDAPPTDLDPNELVLEVRPKGAEKISPPSNDYDGATWLHRFSVVRVVHGQFDGDAVSIIFSSGPCSSYLAPPSNGAATGLLVGFVMPASPDWRDAPGMALRYPGSPLRRQRFDFNLVARVMQDDPAAMMEALRIIRDPAVKKPLYERAGAILKERADAGDASAMTQLGLALRQRASFDFEARVDAIAGPYVDPSRELVQRAAALGDPDAMYLMAGRNMMDPSRPLAERRATQAGWFLKAAEAGHACAMGQMAQNYRFGRGVAVDKEQSLYWYRKAIAAGAIMSPYGYEIEGEPPPGEPSQPSLQCPPTS